MAVDPLLQQQDALQDADVAHQLYNPAIPQNPPPEHGMKWEMDDENPLAHMAQTPALPREDEPMPAAARAGMMAGVAANTSNAFEHIRIQWIRSKILAFTKRFVSQKASDRDLEELPRRFKELQAELDAFKNRLPTAFRWTTSNLRLRAYHPRLCVFLMTHIWWRQCHCDLYRIVLVGRRESLSRRVIAMLDPALVKHCQTQCFEHAKAMAEMFTQVTQYDKGVPISDLDLPVCVYQCVNTLYYTLAVCPDDFHLSPAIVDEMANNCLKITKQSAPGPAALAIVSFQTFML